MMQIKRRLKRLFLNLFYRRLWTQIAIILIVIVTIPVVVLGMLLINTSQVAVRNSVLSNHKEIATRAAGEIELFIRRAEDILNTTAAMLGAVYPAFWKQETMLVELILDQPIFMRVSSVDLSGRELASSELGRGLNWDYPKDALLKIREKKTYISELKVLDYYTPYVTMAVPVRRMGKTVSALIADANLRGIWDIVDNITLGKTGRAFLVSGDGTLIAHQDKKRVLKGECFADDEDVREVLFGKTDAMELEDKSGKRWISSFAAVSGLEWGIVIRQEQNEAYLFSKVMKMQSWIIIIFSELVVIMVSIFMAQVLIRPIKTLVAQTKKVAAGDLEHKIGIRRRDEIGELIRSFNDMTEKLKKAKARERLSAIGEAAAWIAHELKNSLVPIKAFVQLFPRKHRDKKFVDRFSKLMPGEINRWECMLKDLTDFSSHSKLTMVQTDVNKILESILEMMADKFQEKEIDIKYNQYTDNICIVVDPQKLKQVFMNLIINAINAMPKGGSLTVSIALMYRGDLNIPAHIEVKIRDTGKGIPFEDIDKIFEPFHTDSNEGIGLGLSISRKIIEQHGGNITVESKTGFGTMFIVRLPITQPQL